MQRNSAASSAPTKRSMSIKHAPLRFVLVCIAKNRRHRTALCATVDANAHVLSLLTNPWFGPRRIGRIADPLLSAWNCRHAAVWRKAFCLGFEDRAALNFAHA